MVKYLSFIEFAENELPSGGSVKENYPLMTFW